MTPEERKELDEKIKKDKKLKLQNSGNKKNFYINKK